MNISQAMGIEDDPNSISYGRVSRDDLMSKIPVKSKVSMLHIIPLCSRVKPVSPLTSIQLFTLCAAAAAAIEADYIGVRIWSYFSVPKH
jgi:hypothetical protein